MSQLRPGFSLLRIALPYRYRTVRVGKHVPRAREAVAALQLDVLVFAELGMDLHTYLLSFARLAHRQVRRTFDERAREH